MTKARNNAYNVVFSGTILKTQLTPLKNKRDSPDSIRGAPIVSEHQLDGGDSSVVDQNQLLMQLEQQHGLQAFHSPLGDPTIYLCANLPPHHQQTLVYPP